MLWHAAVRLSLSQLGAKSGNTSGRKALVFLADMDGSLLAQMPKPLFQPIQGLIKNTANILWVARVECLGQGQSSMPFLGVKDGFLRAMRSE